MPLRVMSWRTMAMAGSVRVSSCSAWRRSMSRMRSGGWERGGRQALGCEESPDAVRHAGASGLECEELAMQVPVVLGLGGRDMDDGPHVTLPGMAADDRGEERGG